MKAVGGIRETSLEFRENYQEEWLVTTVYLNAVDRWQLELYLNFPKWENLDSGSIGLWGLHSEHYMKARKLPSFAKNFRRAPILMLSKYHMTHGAIGARH